MPAPLEEYAVQFDDLFGHRAQRRSFRDYLQGLLLPRDRNKTLTALAGTEPGVGAQAAVVQRLQSFVSESTWEVMAVNQRRLELLPADARTAVRLGFGDHGLGNFDNYSVISSPIRECARARWMAGCASYGAAAE